MTGYTVHTGSSKKFTEGWDKIFKLQKSRKKEAAAKSKASRSTAKKKKGKAKKRK